MTDHEEVIVGYVLTGIYIVAAAVVVIALAPIWIPLAVIGWIATRIKPSLSEWEPTDD